MQNPWDWLLRVSPLLAVQLAGIILSLIAMRSSRHRPAAACLATGLFLFTVAMVSRQLLFDYFIRRDVHGQITREERSSAMSVVGYCSVGMEALAMALMIVAGLAWRGGTFTSERRDVVAVHPPAEPMPRLMPAVRLAFIYVPMPLAIAFVVGAVVVGQRRRLELQAFVLLGVAMVLIIVGAVAVVMTIHALWKTLQVPPRGVGVDRGARMTPGLAVGLLFVPLFNLYWLFQVWVGFATDCNRTLAERGIAASPVPRGLAIAVCVCAVFSAIPYIGLIGSVANLVMFPILLWRAMGAANVLRTAAE